MAKIWEPNKAYHIARYYVDFITRTGFSSIKVFGREKLPADGAILYAPNHCAALLDPLMILLLKGTKDPVGFGARADLFKKKPIAAIMRWLRILPLARERDGLKEVSKNYAIFDEIADCLRHDVPFCIYAEGTHRAQRGMLPLKKGIFKICKTAYKDLGKPLYIVPVGVNYEYFFKQMGEVEIHIGDPIDVTKAFESQGDTPDGEFFLAQRQNLHKAISSLIDRYPKNEKGSMIPLRLLGAVISLPVFAACAIASLPVWGIAELIMMSFKDKAWTHTVYFACRGLMPLLLPFYWVFSRLGKFYRNILKDIKR